MTNVSQSKMKKKSPEDAPITRRKPYSSDFPITLKYRSIARKRNPSAVVNNSSFVVNHVNCAHRNDAPEWRPWRTPAKVRIRTTSRQTTMLPAKHSNGLSRIQLPTSHTAQRRPPLRFTKEGVPFALVVSGILCKRRSCLLSSGRNFLPFLCPG